MPILAITQYGTEEYIDGSIVFVCFSLVEDLFPCIFFLGSIVIFFIFPLAILMIVYALIAKTLMHRPMTTLIGPTLSSNNKSSMPSQNAIKHRKQVILMLGTVVLAFFLCLLPFRALTFWIIVAPPGSNFEIGFETYYNILYFCRIMFHINSAVNPILYNIISSKFRGGFLRLCGARVRSISRRKEKNEITRKSTSSSTHASSQHTSETFLHSGKKRCTNSLKDIKEEEPQTNNTMMRTDVYVRAPPQLLVFGQKFANGEVYV